MFSLAFLKLQPQLTTNGYYWALSSTQREQMTSDSLCNRWHNAYSPCPSRLPRLQPIYEYSVQSFDTVILWLALVSFLAIFRVNSMYSPSTRDRLDGSKDAFELRESVSWSGDVFQVCIICDLTMQQGITCRIVVGQLHPSFWGTKLTDIRQYVSGYAALCLWT